MKFYTRAIQRVLGIDPRPVRDGAVTLYCDRDGDVALKIVFNSTSPHADQLEASLRTTLERAVSRLTFTSWTPGPPCIRRLGDGVLTSGPEGWQYTDDDGKTRVKRKTDTLEDALTAADLYLHRRYRLLAQGVPSIAPTVDPPVEPTTSEVERLRLSLVKLRTSLSVLSSAVQTMVKWEPSGWPSRECASVWTGGWLGAFRGVWVEVSVIVTPRGVVAWPYDWHEEWLDGDQQNWQQPEWRQDDHPAAFFIPLMDGRPVSWSEVEKALMDHRQLTEFR